MISEKPSSKNFFSIDKTQENRRLFIKKLVMAGVGLSLFPLFSKSALAQNNTITSDNFFWKQPRLLTLYRTANKESIDICYWENGSLNLAGYTQACWLLRDVQANQWTYMDPRLLDLLCAIQAWVRQYGYHEPLHIHSGFRTPYTNLNTEGAAKNSMHLQAKAVDFTMPGLSWEYVGKLAAHYAAGGVGFYPSAHFIHVDTGRLRYWMK